MTSPICSHRDFSLERDHRGNLIFMFNNEYSFEFGELVDFLKLLQLDQGLWKELASLYVSKECGAPRQHSCKEDLPWLLR